MKKVLLVTAVLALASTQVSARDSEYNITLKNHQFTPKTLVVPADKKIKITIDNQDPTAEEFESDDLNKEKIIKGNSKATIFVGPLKPGTYEYSGEFNDDTAKGEIVVK